MNLVLTIAIGEAYERLAKLTHPSIRAYAEKIGAEFMCIGQTGIAKTTPHWEKFQIAALLDHYERILYIDTDIIVRPDTPDLFALVPDYKLGAFNEARFTDRSRELMIDICRAYGETLPDWNGAYYNSGVMVIGQAHRNIFAKPDREVFSFYEQSYINMQIALRKPEIHELTHHFNRMTCMDRFTGEPRHASYLIHYAGYPNLEHALQLIPQDLARWQADAPQYKYRRHIYVAVTGGLGDQISAEPAVRYMREQMYPDDEFVIATHEPRFFAHLERCKVVEHGKADLKDDTPYFICETLPGPSTLQWAVVSHMTCHPVDYTAIALIHRTLPLADRRIRFNVELSDYASLFDKAGTTDLSDRVVIHPGRHWDSKTFPAEFWQGIIDAVGDRAVVVGRTEAGDPPLYLAGARGTVDVDCSGCLDLRDRLSVGELAALLSSAECLVSNDSFPVHLAGAFDKRIVLIPSCKHPDHILPYRYGSPYWNAAAVYHRLTLDDLDSRPTRLYETKADDMLNDWADYLPSIDEVTEAVWG